MPTETILNAITALVFCSGVALTVTLLAPLAASDTTDRAWAWLRYIWRGVAVRVLDAWVGEYCDGCGRLCKPSEMRHIPQERKVGGGVVLEWSRELCPACYRREMSGAGAMEAAA